MDGNEHVLEVRDLRKSFGDLQAVRGVGFHIDPGETYGLLGPNGAGKTTSISMVAGILSRDGGDVSVAGRPIGIDTTEARREIGLVPQEVAVYPELTGHENLRFFGRLYGMEAEALKGRIAEVLDVIGLSERADDRTKEYSGGMKRRLNIGIGLLHRPRLLILDEPTVGVDPQSRNAILESVENLSAAGMSVLYTTHYMEEAERLCDRVGIIDEGEIKAEGTRRELVSLVGEKDQIRLTASGDLEAAVTVASGLEGVTAASQAEAGIHVVADSAASVLPSLLVALSTTTVQVTGVEVDQPNLEAVFLHLTGRALRDR